MLLEQEAVRRGKFATTGYSWDAPLFDSPTERRRLRILNAIFLAAHRAGCAASIDTSRRAPDNMDASIRVGEQFVSFTLRPMPLRKRSGAAAKERLRLTIHSRRRDSDSLGNWEDDADGPLERKLHDITVALLVSAEMFHRENAVSHFNWLVERRAAVIAEERRWREEEQREARELAARLEQERIDSLVTQADSLRRADTIRRMVALVRERAAETRLEPSALESWCRWASAQADRIDPLLNGEVLSAIKREAEFVLA